MYFFVGFLRLKKVLVLLIPFNHNHDGSELKEKRVYWISDLYRLCEYKIIYSKLKIAQNNYTHYFKV